MKITEKLKRVSYASMLLACFYVVRMVLSVFMRSSIAKFFGAEGATDAYYAAMTIPQLLGNCLIGAIIYSIIIPVFQQRKADVGEDEALRDVSGLINVSVVGLLVLTVIYIFLIPFIVPLLFSFKGESLEMTIAFSKYLAPLILFMGLCLIYTAFYHAHKDFLTPAIATIIYPIATIAGIWFAPYNLGIKRMIIGNIVGSLVGIAILVFCIRKKIKWRWNWNISNPLILKTLLLAWPLIVADGIGKFIPLFQKSAASRLPAGTLSLLAYALFLTGAVTTITGPLLTSVFPLMGEQKARGNIKLLFNTFNKTLNVMLFITIPFWVLLLSQSGNIVDLVLGYGKFNSYENNIICARLLMITSCIIVPGCLSDLIYKYFLVYQETFVFSMFGIVTTLIIIPLYFFASNIYFIAAIAVFAKLILIMFEVIYLKIRHGEFSIKSLSSGALKLLIAGIVMYVVADLLGKLISNVSFVFIRLVICSFAGTSIYIIITYLLKVEALRFFAGKIPFIGKYAENIFI